MELKVEDLVVEIERASVACLDTMILIYHLEDIRPYSEMTKVLLELLVQGKIRVTLSTLTVTELLAKPYALNDGERLQTAERFLGSLPNARICPVDFRIAKKAAEVRGRHGFKTPDALIVATALESGAKLFITNDLSLRKVEGLGLKPLILDDYLSANSDSCES